jgi:hypothetical protein
MLFRVSLRHLALATEIKLALRAVVTDTLEGRGLTSMTLHSFMNCRRINEVKTVGQRLSRNFVFTLANMTVVVCSLVALPAADPCFVESIKSSKLQHDVLQLFLLFLHCFFLGLASLLIVKQLACDAFKFT